jgi:hypothetical protein
MRSIRGSIMLRQAVVAALGLGLLGAASVAGAQTAKEQELEQRVAELEKLVQQLQKQVAAPAAATTAPAAVAAAPAKPDAKAVQSGTITPNAAAGTSFFFSGYAKVDGMWTKTPDGEMAENTPSGAPSPGRDFYVPGSTPITAPTATKPYNEGTDFDAHAKQTRLILGTDTPLSGGDKVSTRFEFDFFGTITGDQRSTNAYAATLRHAYVQWGHWLAGQTWSNFQDATVLVDSVDYIGATDGTVFVRQPQIRFTTGGLSLSLENSETTITPYCNPLATTPCGNTRITTDDSSFPDLTARYTWKGTWGSLSLAGLARELKYQTTGTGAFDTTTWSAAGSLSGKFNIGKDDIRFMLLGGNLGRYVALNLTNDAVLDSHGDLQSIDGVAGFVAYRHVWSDRWRSNLYFAMGEYNNDEKLTGGFVNKSSESWTINTWFTPVPKLDVGAEYRHAVRELENGDDGSFDRLQFTTKYSF